MQHFQCVSQEEKNSSKTHICRHCNCQLNGSKEWNLAQHLKKCHVSIYEEIAGKKESQEEKRLKLLQHCVEIISVNGRPFASLLDSGFQAVVKDKITALQSTGHGINLSRPDLNEVKAHLQITSNQIQNEIRKETENRPLSLLVDIVTRQRRAICGFSIQYISNGQLKIRSIGMVELLKKHSGIYIADVIIQRLNEFGISLKQIITITTDNGSNVLKMVRDINDHLQFEIDNAKVAVCNPQCDENESLPENADDLIEEFLNEETEITDEDAWGQLMEEANFNENGPPKTLLNAISDEISTYQDDIHDITGVNCAEHTLQLAIGDAMTHLSNAFKNVIALSKCVCKFLRLASTSIEMNATDIEYTIPHIENSTRWGTMYLMVRFIIILVSFHF